MGLCSSFPSSRGKVETTSNLARWRVKKLDTMGPWRKVRSDTTWPSPKEWSYCYSDPFKFGTWEWYLVIAKKELIMLFLKYSCAAMAQPPIARYRLRVLDTELGRGPYISSVSVADFRKGFTASSQSFNTPEGPFIVDIEFLDLQISPIRVGKDLPTMGPLGIKTTLPCCLPRMLKEGVRTDVTLNTVGGVLQAHKAVLSASSRVFESIFLLELKEKETSTLNVEDLSLETCTALLGCMYGTIKLEEFLKQRFLLLVVADKYGMNDIKYCIEKSLMNDVSSSNVLERLQEARLFQLENLKKVCLKHLFDFGIMSEERDEISSFFRHTNKDVMLMMLQQTDHH